MAKIGKSARIKGKNFELEIAKIISEWWGSKLRRVPNSGGLNIKGDIMTENIEDMKDFPLHLELKKQERHNVRDYYTQSEHDCPKGKIPTVIFSRNNDYKFIMMKLEDFLNFTKRLTYANVQKKFVEESGTITEESKKQ